MLSLIRDCTQSDLYCLIMPMKFPICDFLLLSNLVWVRGGASFISLLAYFLECMLTSSSGNFLLDDGT